VIQLSKHVGLDCRDHAMQHAATFPTSLQHLDRALARAYLLTAAVRARGPPGITIRAN
jgi:hypothetical protein